MSFTPAAIHPSAEQYSRHSLSRLPRTLFIMSMDEFIHIRSRKFPVLPGEREELINDGLYGRAVAQYLQAKLGERGYDAPFFCCEDWG